MVSKHCQSNACGIGQNGVVPPMGFDGTQNQDIAAAQCGYTGQGPAGVLPENPEGKISKQVQKQDGKNIPVAVAYGGPAGEGQQNGLQGIPVSQKRPEQQKREQGQGKVGPDPEKTLPGNLPDVGSALFQNGAADAVAGIKQKRHHNQLPQPAVQPGEAHVKPAVGNVLGKVPQKNKHDKNAVYGTGGFLGKKIRVKASAGAAKLPQGGEKKEA